MYGRTEVDRSSQTYSAPSRTLRKTIMILIRISAQPECHTEFLGNRYFSKYQPLLWKVMVPCWKGLSGGVEAAECRRQGWREVGESTCRLYTNLSDDCDGGFWMLLLCSFALDLWELCTVCFCGRAWGSARPTGKRGRMNGDLGQWRSQLWVQMLLLGAT